MSISIKKRSLIKILKSKGPRTEPCSISIEICFAELYVESTALCVRLSRSYKLSLVFCMKSPVSKIFSHEGVCLLMIVHIFSMK